MPSPRRCHRHAANVWVAHCPDCTAWHLTAQIARRNGGPLPRTPCGSLRCMEMSERSSKMSGAVWCSVPTDPARLGKEP